ncbi:MAG: hypothetical protein H7Y37_06965 [Anaerolineae bacterium]|nr:hypothetical protein [Gloeobacterales cyanobacterium ES-bin-313]
MALGGLLPETVFVGGAAMQVHLLDSDADVRTTEDVDCVVEITTRADYYAYANELRKRGFQEDTREGAPLCRWRFRGITVDVMPCSEEVLGYSNRWYPPGIQSSECFVSSVQKNRLLTTLPKDVSVLSTQDFDLCHLSRHFFLSARY